MGTVVGGLLALILGHPPGLGVSLRRDQGHGSKRIWVVTLLHATIANAKGGVPSTNYVRDSYKGIRSQ